MVLRDIQPMRRAFGSLVVMVLVLACVPLAGASATLLIEEPYGTLGFFTPTGHAAVYLSGVCAETPLILRKCAPGETGVVISRYDGVGKHDWIAIPLVPYLYAVERPEDVPLFADAKMVAFLRDRYRRQYLEDIAPDIKTEPKNGETPGGNWYELVGSSYDRTTYGFEIETTPEQDEALIRKLNSSPNESHFHLVSRNCADFAKDIINFYYPKSLHRSIVVDLGMTTPKQMAKRITKYSRRHPELQFSRLVIAQVPGSVPRSTTIHGVVDAFLTSKKYIVPSAIVSPIFAGCVAAVYVTTGAGRFEPAHNAIVYIVGSQSEPPVGHEDLRAHREQLKHFLAGAYPEKPGKKVDRAWAKLQSRATAAVDDQGRPVLQMEVAGNPVSIGASAGNVQNGSAPPQLVAQLLEARLQSELRRKSAATVSESEIARDWKLLQQTMAEPDAHLTAPSGARTDNIGGTRP